jgi:hypothetical protein
MTDIIVTVLSSGIDVIPIVIALGIVFFGLAWISFKLNESEEDITRYTGLVFLACSIITLQIISWVAYQTTDQFTSLGFLSGGLFSLFIISNVVMTLFWFVLLVRSLVALGTFLVGWVVQKFGRMNG